MHSPEHLHQLIAHIVRKGATKPLPGAADRDTVDAFMDALDTCMQGHGIESIAESGVFGRGGWGGTAALYVNVGDSESTTVLFDTDEEVLVVTSVADWIRKQEQEGRSFD